MGGSPARTSSTKSKAVHTSLLIFAAGMLLTIMLWDSYFNGSYPAGRGFISGLIFLMGALFSISAGLFAWSIETRRDYLQQQVERRTKELNDINAQLNLKNQEIENFIQIISHDLKAPLVSIQGFSSILKKELIGQLSETHGDYLERILVNLKHMNLLIMDLLEFSRVGRMEDEKESVVLTELFKEIADEMKSQIDKKNIEMKISGHLPCVYGSKKRLSQVFTNLISNAVKYMGTPDRPFIEIGTTGGGNGKLLEIWVQDNGIGIAKEYHDRIFQIFQRAPNSLKEEGTGIGLCIVKKIVEVNGGTISVASEPGKGSRFTVFWPSNSFKEQDEKDPNH